MLLCLLFLVDLFCATYPQGLWILGVSSSLEKLTRCQHLGGKFSGPHPEITNFYQRLTFISQYVYALDIVGFLPFEPDLVWCYFFSLSPGCRQIQSILGRVAICSALWRKLLGMLSVCPQSGQLGSSFSLYLSRLVYRRSYTDLVFDKQFELGLYQISSHYWFESVYSWQLYDPSCLVTSFRGDCEIIYVSMVVRSSMYPWLWDHLCIHGCEIVYVSMVVRSSMYPWLFAERRLCFFCGFLDDVHDKEHLP
jgi:hypothetical protein